MSDRLRQNLLATSPRFARIPTPPSSLIIHGLVLLLWVATFVAAFLLHGVFAWSVGIAYIAYDTILLGFVFCATLPLVVRQPLAQSQAPRTSLGVIIAAHNEAVVLPETLAALFAQTDPADLIVIADDGSTDGTAALLADRYGLVAAAPGTLSSPSVSHPNLRWLRLPHSGKGFALNAAVQNMSTDAIVTVDGDTLLESTALAAVRAAFTAEAGLVATTGILIPVCSASWTGRVFEWFQTYEYIRNFLSRYAWERLDSLLLISGAFAGFRRSALLEVGGFDIDCLVEDYELIHRLRRHAGRNGLPWTTRVLGSARARTEAPGTVPAFLRQRRRWFGGFLQTQYWYRDMVGARRYGWLGLLMLPVKAFDTLQPLYGLTGLLVLLVVAALGHRPVLLPASALILAKVTIDLAFHLWSVRVYRVWVGERTGAQFGMAFLAAVAEPFTFQILRHLGAAWGWVVFLTGRKSWGTQERIGVAERER